MGSCISRYRYNKSYNYINKYFIACLNGNLALVQHIYYSTLKKNKLKAKALAERGFIDSCLCGHKNIAEWFVQNAPDLDIHAEDDAAFRLACVNGFLPIALWLYNLGNVNIHSRDDIIFKKTLLSGKIEIVKFIYSLSESSSITLDWNELFTDLCNQKLYQNHKIMAEYLYSIKSENIDRQLYITLLHTEILE